MPAKLKRLPKKFYPNLKVYLDEVVKQVEVTGYIEHDPIQFMHAFEDKKDQEIAGFFAAIMAWGRRDIVINKVNDLLERMDYRPHQFVQSFREADAEHFADYKHRTFKPIDIYWLIKGLQSIYQKFEDFEAFWKHCYYRSKATNRELIAIFHESFFDLNPETPQRSRKHISNPEKNSSCKRLYMYLRWCLRKSEVDPGIMNFMPVTELRIPLDVHVARIARALGILTRTYNDWKAVLELDENLKLMDPDDHTRYDFALFGIGVLKSELPRELIRNPKQLS